MEKDQPIKFDRPKLNKLKRAYAKAVKEKEEWFTFEGRRLLVAYAKYLIEYLDELLTK